MNKASVIRGEASETDSEEELPPILPSPIQGVLIAKEALEAESDEESSLSSAASALTLHKECNNSLLQQKLKESNEKFYNDLNQFLQSTLVETGKSLNNLDQNLIKSQLAVQNGVSSLKNLQGNAVRIKNKLQFLLSAQFIPINIKIN